MLRCTSGKLGRDLARGTGINFHILFIIKQYNLEISEKNENRYLQAATFLKALVQAVSGGSIL